MKKIKITTSIDYLKICYKQSEDIFTWLVKNFNLNGEYIPSTEDNIIDCYNYKLHLIKSESDSDKITFISTAVLLPLDGELHKLGEFEFTNSGKYQGLCFFTFENKALYTIFSNILGDKSNLVCFLDWIADDLGLQFNNITKCDIALDTNKNLIKIYRKFIKDYENYDMFLNGNLVKDEHTILSDYGEFYGRTREQISKQPTLYFKQKKDTGLQLKVYNKSREMEQSEPSKLAYIVPWLDYGNESIYRAEVSVRNCDIADFCGVSGHYPEELTNLLTNSQWRANLWLNCANRLVRFREKKSGADIDLIDAVGI